MGLESATYINQLNASNPIGGDARSTADDHIRLIKNVLKSTFSGITGQVTVTQAELNLLSGLTTLASFPTGTKLTFAQAAAPTGWTQVTDDTANNRMLRVVNTAGGGTGGTHSPILNNVVPSHTHNFSTNAVNIDHVHSDAGHYHVSGSYGISYGAVGIAYGSVGLNSGGDQVWSHTQIGYSSIGGMNANQIHAHSGNTDGGSSSTNWQPRYLDHILCSKN